MRPWIVLGAAAVGLGIAGLLTWPRGEERVLLRDAPLSKDEAPRGAAFPETAPAPGVPLPETAPPAEESETLPDELIPPPTPEEVHAPPEPEADSDRAALVDATGGPSRTLVRAALADALARRYPDLERSPEEIDRAADAVLRIRAAQEALAALPLTLENAGRRLSLREKIQVASAAFREAIGLSPDEFTEGLEAAGGVDRFDPDEPIPEPSYLGEPAPEGVP